MFVWDEDELNSEQADAVLEERSVFLVACPGSGKTRALIYKIADALGRLSSHRQMVVALTYTNRAAEEIRERIEQLGVNTTQLWIGTIHAFCLEWILRPYSIYIPRLAHGYRVIDAHEQQLLFETLCEGMGRVTHWDCDYYATESGYEIGCQDTSKHEALTQVIGRYFDALEQAGMIDFELILYYAAQLIAQRPQIAELISKVFPWVLIDEYQDTKKIQYSIVASIVRAGRGATRVFIVGDPNQSIYGSLGGLAMPVATFRSMCQVDIVEKELSKNYRSTERIVGFFGNFNVFGTQVDPAAKHRLERGQISFQQNIAKQNLGDELARLVRASVECHHISPGEICVVAPQWTLLASITRRLVALLPDYHFDGPGMVPFSRDPENFWYRLSRIALTTAAPELYVRRIRWAREVLRSLQDVGIDTSELSARTLLRESNSIVVEEAEGLNYLRAYFGRLFKRIGIDYTAHPYLNEHFDAFFASSQAKIDRLRSDGSEFITGIDFFRKVFRQRTGVTVSTIHGVKGAEFDVVIAYGLLEGMVPHFSDRDGAISAKKMLYVVGSRARKRLHLISEQGRRRGSRGDYEPTSVLANCRFNYDQP